MVQIMDTLRNHVKRCACKQTTNKTTTTATTIPTATTTGKERFSECSTFCDNATPKSFMTEPWLWGRAVALDEHAAGFPISVSLLCRSWQRPPPPVGLHSVDSSSSSNNNNNNKNSYCTSRTSGKCSRSYGVSY